ncbi:RNA-guided endonuclease TnpB family protein [Chloroflexus sp. MS-CIW-1]|uniref:RNA-guided endonuclease InsQ/TnpB family protein n=1 Tax=Chloroflexus sp. MS-CIW-1 TaxID=3055768 RepID=UPI002649D813|nr:RNA-guided endonuclease TnpB family protein [Chloroflexus sp. MS-CIW-1]MDN5273091.1 RNA-guided endonuclease TnpB family protein [Chloroflexus sp. MS-CIW-1]
MQRTHKIALCPTPEQVDYVKRACGTARRVWNWALNEWNRQYAAGGRPNAMALKKQFNAIKYTDPQWLDEKGRPWLRDIHRDAHAQPFAHLAKAWERFFTDLKAGKEAHAPRFKKKGRCRDSFYVANDKFRLDGKTIRLPKIGDVAMTEELRFKGKILGATVSRTADRWFVAIQVEVPDAQCYRRRTAHDVNGIDLGVTAAATISSGEVIEAPKPLNAALRRLKIRGRRLSRKLQAAKEMAGFGRHARLPKGTRLPVSNNRRKSAATLARLYARLANLRADVTHKLTTRLCRENQAVVIEDVNVKGMLANERLARAISDVGFGVFRSQVEYKAKRYGTHLIIADRWYPSSRLCSKCGWKNEALTLSDREWVCAQCGERHDRDLNAARNLKRLATETALPVASPTSNGGAAAGTVPAAAGKVTPVRDDGGHQDTSGQEEKCAHFCALS